MENYGKMKQDVNFFLLATLVLVLVVMVAMAIYAQNEYHGLNEKHAAAQEELKEKSQELDRKAEEINKTRTELEDRQRVLVDIVRELNLSAERESSLGGFFENLKGQKEVLETNLNSTVQEREEWKKKYTTSQNDLQVCDQAKKLVEDDAKKQRAKVEELRRNFRDLGAAVNKSQAELSSIASTSSSIRDDLYDLNKMVNGLTEPTDISTKAKRDIKDGVSDIQSSVDNSLQSYVDSLRSTLADIGRRIDGAVKA